MTSTSEVPTRGYRYIWTDPHYGVTHCGDCGTDKWWATVVSYGSFHTLLRWYPGCQFHPHEDDYTSLADAKLAGVAWLKEHNVRGYW